MWRLDAHNDRRTGTTVRNGRKDFGDVMLSVGLNIAIGEAAVPVPPPPTEPVEVVAVETPPDADGDGVVDELDQCPETPAGTAVDAKGCPAAAASVCKAPEPGEKLDLSGCASGDVIVLRGVNFDFNKDRLTPNAKTILDGVSEALKAAPTTNVELGGHTDGKGTDEYNQRLSERRACSVARYLSGRGTEEGRMTPGYGEAKPVADNETDEGREQNRRVELKILDGAGSGLASCSSGIFAPPAPVEPAVETAAEPAAEAAPVTAPDSGGPPAPESPAAVKNEAPPPAEEPAAVSAPEPAPAPEAAAASAGSAPAASAKSMEMVPENDVFGGSSAPAASSEPAAGDSQASSANTQQLVSESEVFGDPSAPAPAASDRPTSASGPPQMVPESEVFGGN